MTAFVSLFLAQALIFPSLAGAYTPVAYYVGSQPSIDGLTPYAGGAVTFNASSPVLTLDYGHEVGGWPYIQVAVDPEVPVQVEFKYSEPFDGLNNAWGDGPWYLIRPIPGSRFV